MPGIVREGPERVGSPAFIRGFTGRQSVGSFVLKASTVPVMTGDEVQLVTISGTPTGGTFTLTYNGRRLPGGGTPDVVGTSATIAYNAAASVVQTALEGIAGIGAGNVGVTGSAGGPYTVEFKGILGVQEMNLLTASAAGLTGGTPAIAVTRVTMGTFDANRRRLWPGTVLSLFTGDNSKVAPYTGTGGQSAATIVGIGGRNNIDLFSGTSESDVDVPVYHFGVHFNINYIRDYALYATDLGNAAALKTCKFS